MNPFFYSEEAGERGCRPVPLHPHPRRTCLRFAPDNFRTISLDDSEHLLHNHRASVASLRLLFTFAPERRSASFRNRCSPSPEYPVPQVSHIPPSRTASLVSDEPIRDNPGGVQVRRNKLGSLSGRFSFVFATALFQGPRQQ